MAIINTAAFAWLVVLSNQVTQPCRAFVPSAVSSASRIEHSYRVEVDSGRFVEARAPPASTSRDGPSPAKNQPCRFLVSSCVNRASGHVSHGCRDALGPIFGTQSASQLEVDGSPERSLKSLHYPHLQLVLLSLSLNASAATSICNPIVKTHVFLQLFILRLFVFMLLGFLQIAFKTFPKATS